MLDSVDVDSPVVDSPIRCLRYPWRRSELVGRSSLTIVFSDALTRGRREEGDGMQEWSRARNFRELCDINARFILGELSESPLHGPIDDETKEIEEFLVRLNREGFLTTHSQPGVEMGSYKQRAQVDGFADRRFALEIGARELYSELRIEFLPVDSVRFLWMPITQEDGQPTTWVGSVSPKEDELFQFGRAITPDVLAELQTKWFVCVVDPVWGRKEYLWETLLKPKPSFFSIRPRPEEEG